MNDVTIKIHDSFDRAELNREWEQLANDSATSFFQSWAWIGLWIDSLPKEFQPKLLVASRGDDIVGLGVLCENHLKTKLKQNSRALLLSETGDSKYDSLAVEYSGFVIKRNMEDIVVSKIIHFFKEETPYEELVLGGLLENDYKRYIEPSHRQNLTINLVKKSEYYFIDLNTIRESAQDYLSHISRNSRYQIRRSIKAYEKMSRLNCHVADSEQLSLEYFGNMIELHQQYWKQKGQSGAFGKAFTKTFHTNLVKRGFEGNKVQLIKISAGDEIIGYLYNFCHEGRVYSYQSGFDYRQESKYKPGLVSHYMAIEHYLGGDNQIYDFLAGFSQYKRSMATKAGTMYWIGLRKPLLKYRIESIVAKLYRKMKR